MSSRSSSHWMWAEACDLLDEAARMQRRFFHLAASGQMHAAWEPPVDVFEDEREFLVIVALPGVPADRITVANEPGMLVIRAERRTSFAGANRVVRRIEIPYGSFERRIPLPDAALQSVESELVDGCLILRLRKADY